MRIAMPTRVLAAAILMWQSGSGTAQVEVRCGDGANSGTASVSGLFIDGMQPGYPIVMESPLNCCSGSSCSFTVPPPLQLAIMLPSSGSTITVPGTGAQVSFSGTVQNFSQFDDCGVVVVPPPPFAAYPRRPVSVASNGQATASLLFPGSAGAGTYTLRFKCDRVIVGNVFVTPLVTRTVQIVH